MENAKTVLVTGGSRGLGLGIVKTLLASGYRVGACSRKISEPLQELIDGVDDQTFYWQPCELGNEADEKRFFDDFLEWSGKAQFYGLINNAGIAQEGILATFPNADTTRIIEVNLMAAIRMARLAVRVFLARPGAARIINISSIIAIRGYTGLAAYSASKSGLDGLTRSLAREVGRRKITVNSVNPGYLETEMSESLAGPQRNQIIRRTPLGRLGQVDDITPMVSFLLSPGADFITGQSLVVDGGISS